MPSVALKSMSKEAGVSLAKAERYWKEAKEQARKESPDDFYAYVTGIVKKRMGLESRHLLNAGVPKAILDSADYGEDTFDKAMLAVAISELLKADLTSSSTKLVDFDTAEGTTIGENFRQAFEMVEQVSEGARMEYLKALFPSLTDDLLKLVVFGPNK